MLRLVMYYVYGWSLYLASCRYAYELGAEPVLGAGFAKWVRRKGHRLSTNVSEFL